MPRTLRFKWTIDRDQDLNPRLPTLIRFSDVEALQRCGRAMESIRVGAYQMLSRCLPGLRLSQVRVYLPVGPRVLLEVYHPADWGCFYVSTLKFEMLALTGAVQDWDVVTSRVFSADGAVDLGDSVRVTVEEAVACILSRFEEDVHKESCRRRRRS